MASTKTIEISGSGKLSLTVDADIVTMSGRDRSFVVALLEMLERHGVEHRPPGTANPAPEPTCLVCGIPVGRMHRVNPNCVWYTRAHTAGGSTIVQPTHCKPTDAPVAVSTCPVCGNSVGTTHDTRCLWHVRWAATGGRGIGEPLVTELQCERTAG